MANLNITPPMGGVQTYTPALQGATDNPRNRAEAAINASYVTFRNLPLTASSTVLTYALTSLGTLNTTITFNISGWYEIA